ncbi:MAG: protein kinase domain-containing protein [Phycisphaerae bacterium]
MADPHRPSSSKGATPPQAPTPDKPVTGPSDTADVWEQERRSDPPTNPDSSSLTIDAIRAAAERARHELEMESLNETDPDVSFLRDNLTEFEVLHCVHRGGQGAVYRAIERATGQHVALKILLDGPLASPKAKQRFAQEIEMIGHIDHPNIVSLKHRGTVRGRHYLVMDFIEGHTLPDFALLHRLNLRQRLNLMIKVCHAVSYAHQQGIIHRDLKPGNILVDAGGEPHILDFGLAKIIDDERNRSDSITQTGQVVGTLPFLPPERVAGSPDAVDVRADIYALGVLLFHLISGSHPFPINETTDVIRRHIIFSEPRTLRQTVASDELHDILNVNEISDDLEAIVAMALEKDVRLRYQSADALARELQSFLLGDVVQAKADRQFYVLAKALRRYKGHAAVAVLALIFLFASLIGVTFAWRSAEETARIAQAGMQMGSYLKLGINSERSDNQASAIELTQQAIKIGTPFAGDTGIKCALFDAHYRLAEIYLREREYEAALPHVTQAVAMIQQLNEIPAREIKSAVFLESEKEAAEYVESKLALSLRMRGKLSLQTENYDDAIAALKESAAHFGRLMTAGNQEHDFQLAYAAAQGLLGRAYREAKRLDEALTHYQEDYRIKRERLTEDPTNASRAISLAVCLNKLCVWHMDGRTRRDYDLALAYMDEAYAVLERAESSGAEGVNQMTLRRLKEALTANRSETEKRIAKLVNGEVDPVVPNSDQ